MAGSGCGRGSAPVRGGGRPARRHPRRDRLPAGGRPGLAGTPAVLPRPCRRRLAHRPSAGPGRRAALREQRARLESTRRAGTGAGKLDDPETEAAAADAAELAYRVARGEGKLFSVGLHITVHADDEQTLAEELASVRAVAESLLLRVVPATFRALRGWPTTLPFGVDLLNVRRTFDTQALAASFPFASPDLPPADPVAGGVTESAVLYGANTASTSLVLWDRFAADNHNSVTSPAPARASLTSPSSTCCGPSYQGVDALVVDPEGECTRLADHVGGTVVRARRARGPVEPVRPAGGGDRGRGCADAAGAVLAHTLLSVLLGGTASIAVDAPCWTRRSWLRTGRLGSPRTRGPGRVRHRSSAICKASWTNTAPIWHRIWRRGWRRSLRGRGPGCSTARPRPTRVDTWWCSTFGTWPTS
ncbi:hypothetical protein ACU686_10025 [Yinghuangia aomiensis]